MLSKGIRYLLVGASLAAVVGTPCLGATWNLVGTSAWSQARPIAPGQTGGPPAYMLTNADPYQDWRRVRFNNIIEDGAGNIYATAANNNNDAATIPGGITIYRPNGSGGYTQVDVNLAPPVAPNPPNLTNGLNLPGEIIRMVVSPNDGKVYGLQNYCEITSLFIPASTRILRISPDGTVDRIVDMASTSSNQRITDMAVGSDGNIYYVRQGNTGAKNTYMWRIRIPIPDGVTLPYDDSLNKPEMSPSSLNINNGQAETHYFYDLFYAGTTNSIDSFSIWRNQSGWSLSAMGWNTINSDVTNNLYYRRPADLSTETSPYQNSSVTAGAYDAVRKTMWYASLSGGPTRFWGSGIGSSGVYFSTVDLGGGNKGIHVDRNSTSKTAYWSANVNWNSVEQVTLGARFRIDGYDPGSTNYFLEVGASPFSSVQPPPGATKAAKVGVRLFNIGGADHVVLWDMRNFANDSSCVLYDLGAWSATTWYEIQVYGSDDATGQTDELTVWVGGDPTPVTLTHAPVQGQLKWNASLWGGGVSFGACCEDGQSSGTVSTKAAVTFDWVGAARAKVAPGAAWPDWSTPFAYETAGNYNDGGYTPHALGQGNVMTRWTGSSTLPILFDGVGVPGSNPDPIGGITKVQAFQTLGYSPEDNHVTVDSSKVYGGLLWVSAMAINPCDGTCWFAINGEGNIMKTADGATTQYIINQDNTATPYTKFGRIYTVGAAEVAPSGDQGAPTAERTSVVCALYFSTLTNQVYAVTCDLLTGAYRLYSTPNPSAQCCPIPWADANHDGSVDMTDFGVWQTCFTGTGDPNGKFSFDQCHCFDRDNNSAIDAADFAKFDNCAWGPAVIPPPNCGQ